MNYILIYINFLLFTAVGYAQDSLPKKSFYVSKLFLDAYYSYDFNRPYANEKASFIYNYNKHNEININLALLSISFTKQRVRSNLGLMAGTYAKYNLAGEPKLLRHLFEANAGLRLSNNKNLWIDIGTMPSHIGFENTISNECWTTTRSILAENSPYYETGIKVSYTSKNDKLYTAVLLLNGWQRIKRVEGNVIPAAGTQITYKPNQAINLNWSTFIGNTKPDSISQWRYFNNLYAILKLNNHWGITIGFDYGIEQNQFRSKKFNKWLSPVIITRYEMNKWAWAARLEYYNDNKGVIVNLINNQFFKMQSYSLNIDRKIRSNSLLRLEWRYFYNTSPYFKINNELIQSNHFLTASLVIDFLKL